MPLALFEPHTGPVLDLMPRLQNTISQFKGARTQFKVGLALQPEKRWHEHERSGWKDMVLVYFTTSKQTAQQAEKLLIQHGWQNHYIAESWNIVRDNVILQQSHEGYYVYVVLS